MGHGELEIGIHEIGIGHVYGLFVNHENVIMIRDGCQLNGNFLTGGIGVL